MKNIREILDELEPTSAAKEREMHTKERMENLIAEIYSSGVFYTEAVQAFKKQYITHVLQSKNGNKFQAAIELGMHRNTLDRTIEELKMDRREWDPKLHLSGKLSATKPVQPAAMATTAGAKQA